MIVIAYTGYDFLIVVQKHIELDISFTQLNIISYKFIHSMVLVTLKDKKKLIGLHERTYPVGR